MWWPGINREAEELVRSCHACQPNSSTSQDVPATRTELPAKPWQTFAMDTCGLFPSGDHLLVLTDYGSRWVNVDILRSPTSANIIKCLRHSLTTHGIPVCIVTNNGIPFLSNEFKTHLQESGIKHRCVTPYWPQANGEVKGTEQDTL